MKLGVLLAGAALAVAPVLIMNGPASAQTTAGQNAPAIAGSEAQATNGFVQTVEHEVRSLRGQGTPAIMMTESNYVEEWALDVADALGN